MKLKLKNIASNTGRFVDGNPKTGELGTIVTAEWLNDVQDRVQDVFEEFKNVLALANLQPLDNGTTNQVAEAIRTYCNNLNLKIQSNTRNFDNYISNSKKSNAVNSNSADTVATSNAVKTAYDKGVEAKTAADNANNNANGRVSKNGDTMTGVFNIDYGDYSSINQWNSSRKHARTETLPDSHTNFYKISYRGDNENSELHSVHFPKRGAGKNAAYEDWVNSNYIPRSGDTTINGRHFFKNGASWIGIVSTDSTSAGLDYTVTNGKCVQCSIRAVDIGKFSNEFQFYTTPPGSNYDTDRRQRAMTLGYGGHIWTLAYGWLQDFFAKQSDNNNIWRELNNTYRKNKFADRWYPNHYNGAQVYDIPTRDNGGLRIIIMNVTGGGGEMEFNLPESFYGWTIPTATDVGGGKKNLGISVIDNKRVKVFAPGGQVGVNIQVIGFANF